MSNYYEQYRSESNRMPGWDYSRNGYYFVTPVIQGMKWILGKITDSKMILSDFGKIVKDEWLKSFEIRQELILDEFIIMPNHLHAILIIKHPDNAYKKLQELPSNPNDPALFTIDDFDENEYFDDDLNEFPNQHENFDEIGKEISEINGNYKTAGNGNEKSAGNGNYKSAGNGNYKSAGNGNYKSAGNGNEKSAGNGNYKTAGNGKVQTHGRASLHSPHSMPQRPPHSISSFLAGFKSASTSKIDDFIDLHQLAIPKYNRNNRLWQLNYNDHIIRNHREYIRIKNYIQNNPMKWEKDKFKS